MSQPSQEWWNSIQDLPESEIASFGLKLNKEAVLAVGSKAMKERGDLEQHQLCRKIADGFAKFADSTESPAEVERLAVEYSRQQYAAGGGRRLRTVLVRPEKPGYTWNQAHVAIEKLCSRFFAVIICAATAQLLETPVPGLVFNRDQEAEEVLKGLERLATESDPGMVIFQMADWMWKALGEGLDSWAGQEESFILESVQIAVGWVIKATRECVDRLRSGVGHDGEPCGAASTLVLGAMNDPLALLEKLNEQNAAQWLAWDEGDVQWKAEDTTSAESKDETVVKVEAQVEDGPEARDDYDEGLVDYSCQTPEAEEGGVGLPKGEASTQDVASGAAPEVEEDQIGFSDDETSAQTVQKSVVGEDVEMKDADVQQQENEQLPFRGRRQ